MKVWIDQDLCTGDGLCEEIAPDVFALLDDGLAYVKEGSKIFATVKGNPQGADGLAVRGVIVQAVYVGQGYRYRVRADDADFWVHAIERVAEGPRLMKIGRRLVARPTVSPDSRPTLDSGSLVEDERNRWR